MLPRILLLSAAICIQMFVNLVRIIKRLFTYIKIAIYILILGYCGAIALVLGVGCLFVGLPTIFSELGEAFAYYYKDDNALLPSLTMILFCCIPAIITDLNNTDL